jgi:hypothetical protein
MAISSDSAEQKVLGTVDHEHSADYREMLKATVKNFAQNVAGETVLYSVASDKTVLWNLYLNCFPAHERQHYNCNTCRHFFERYADLVTVDDKGRLTSVMFNGGVSGAYSDHFARLAAMVEGGTIEHVHVSDEKRWGIPQTGVWEHFAVFPPAQFVYKHGYKSAYQEQAEKTHDFETMVRALTEFTAAHLSTAMKILEADVLYRGDSVIGPARWLQEVIEDQDNTKSPAARHNLLWRAVALAPAGFSHPRGNVIGTLLDDIKAGLSFDEIAKKFKAKMDPLQYRRPQSAPGDGNVAQAEKIVAAMGLQNSFKRRFARLEEIQTFWTPKGAARVPTDGLFAGVKTKAPVAKKANPTLVLPTKDITVEKFLEKVVPTAEEMEVQIASIMNFCALTTAADPDAPPILQWDAHTPELRNRVAWYVYTKGSTATQWGQRVGAFVKVNALTRGPAEWNSVNLPAHGKRLLFIMQDVADTMGENVGTALFPEMLKSELNPIRKTIEAFNAQGKLEGLAQASACGVLVSNHAAANVIVRVRSNGTEQLYKLDRWE